MLPRPRAPGGAFPTTRPTAVVVAVAAAVVAACGEAEPPALTVGPVGYTEGQLLGLSESRRETLAYLTALGLAVADSTTDLLGEPLVDEWTDDRLLEILAADLTLEKNDVEEAALEAYYLTDPQWELVVRHILFFSERWRSASHREEAAAKASRALDALRAGADFAETAARLSEEPGAEGREGLLAPGREGSWVPEFWAAARALQPGEVSPVTETQYGFHILRLEDRSVVPFAEARSVVAREVADQIEDPGAVFEAWMDEQMTDPAAARRIALAEAAGRGLSVPPGERIGLERAWADQVYQWSVVLGFRYGLSPQEVATASLEGLSRPGQGADLARSDLARHRALFEARYEIRIGSEGG
jgi:hypothetical protein